MTYQVLARKWRPKGFSTLVGQEHVVRALTHALEQQRLHHAYLFTGTRGVGKTTLSRILAKALNCETGITAQPCGVCKACQAIDAGRFVDYVEMDAASNRGVDEMTSLLEKAIYAPVDARFKVYMIDEVHMLTGHAFNAMLKTLEEPPAHVKFILATTDPQKIPVTVLSRCLQFNLKQMPAGHIVDHLAHILGEEQIAFDNQALRLLAKAANGSMRDALSLTDQAIAYAAGPVNEEAVRGMLGAIDQSVLVRILDALHAGTPKDLIDLADELASRSFSFSAALQDMGSLLHKVALAQMAPDAVSDDWPEAADVRRLAELFAPEEVQLHYQIVTRARSELGLAPDEHSGFSMALLRMAAFRPLLSASPGSVGGVAPVGGAAARTAPRAASSAATAAAAPATPPAAAQAEAAPTATATAMSPAKAALAALQASSRSATQAARRAPAAEPRKVPEPAMAPAAPTTVREVESAAAHGEPGSPAEPNAATETARSDDAPLFVGEWPALAAQLPLRGLAQQLALQSELVSVSGRRFHLRVPLKQLGESGPSEKLREALGAHFGTPVELTIEIGAVNATAAAVAAEVRAQQQQAAEQAIGNDTFVQTLMNEFGAQIVPGSIRPVQ